MLFVAEYELTWDNLEPVIAKRIEWDQAQTEGIRVVGEYVWADRDPPFRGVAIIEAETVGALNAFVLHYGPTLKLSLHAASDVVSSVARVQQGPHAVAEPTRPRARRRGASR